MTTILVAYDANRVIGNKGAIPWSFPEDLKLFKERTVGNIVIMGRKTWESLPYKFRPLPNRKNLVISKSYADNSSLFMQTLSGKIDQSVLCFASISGAISLAKKMSEKVFIIGGSQIYKQVLDKNLVDTIIVSLIEGTHEGDTYFPELDASWKCFFAKQHSGFKELHYRRENYVNGL